MNNQSGQTVCIDIDPTNPGQFFACCGLLELADRSWNGAEGWFDTYTFSMRPLSAVATPSTGQLAAELGRCRLTNIMTEQQLTRLEELAAMTKKERAAVPGSENERSELERLRRESALILHDPFNIQIDWFLDSRSGGNRFKTWAGQQSVVDIARAMKRPIETGAWDSLSPKRWLSQTTDDDGLPFNFDSDLGGQASALDVGFSFDPLGMASKTRPLIELAAFIGLQRFRPRPDAKDNRFLFALWDLPLTPQIASVAASDMLAMPGLRVFEFRLLYRTKYLKSFLSAQPISR
ncbi:MAG: type I-U CRISPR-associated protein Cas8c [Pirellulales bacterium]